jgi:hypothetical protein
MLLALQSDGKFRNKRRQTKALQISQDRFDMESCEYLAMFDDGVYR